MKMVLVRRKGYDIPTSIPEPLLPARPSAVPALLPQPFPTAVTHDETTATSHLTSLPTLQQQQQKSQTLPIGMKPVTSSKYPAQLPLLPPPSRKQFTRNNTAGDIPLTARFNGSDEHQQVTSPTIEHHGPSRTTGLSHSNWPSTLTSDSGKPLKFHSNMDPTVALPQSPNDAPQCPTDSSNTERSPLTSSSNRHKTTLLNDVEHKSEATMEQLPVKVKGKKTPLVPIPKDDDSGDDEIIDSEEDDETSALYAVARPRGTKKSSEPKTPKHSGIRSSNSFKKHKPKPPPPPKPEPYSVSKHKKKSSSPSPIPADTGTESGYVDPSTLDVQEQASTATGEQARVEETVTVDDPSAMYAKVIKKKSSMDLMEPIQLGQVAMLPEQTLMEKDVIPSMAEDDTKTASNGTSLGEIGPSIVNITATATDTPETTDSLFGHAAVQLISMVKTDSDSKPSSVATTTTAPAPAADSNTGKPIPMPRKKHHRSSSLDLNKMFQKRRSAEQLGKNELYGFGE